MTLLPGPPKPAAPGSRGRLDSRGPGPAPHGPGPAPTFRMLRMTLNFCVSTKLSSITRMAMLTSSSIT